MQEEDVKIVYVPIEVEEILEFTSEGEGSSDEEAPTVAEKKILTVEERMKKQKVQPYGGACRGTTLNLKTKKLTHSEEEFKTLGIGRNMGPLA